MPDGGSPNRIQLEIADTHMQSGSCSLLLEEYKTKQNVPTYQEDCNGTKQGR